MDHNCTHISLKPGGTRNTSAAGSPVTMLINLVVLSPLCGSLYLENTDVFSSSEYQFSVTVWIGSSLPIEPALIVLVFREPRAITPSKFCVPRFSDFGRSIVGRFVVCDSSMLSVNR